MKTLACFLGIFAAFLASRDLGGLPTFSDPENELAITLHDQRDYPLNALRWDDSDSGAFVRNTNRQHPFQVSGDTASLALECSNQEELTSANAPGSESPIASTQPVIELKPATDGKVVALWPDNAIPGSRGTEPNSIGPNQDRLKVGGVRYVSVPDITVYPSKSARAPAPAILVCPGGGYHHLAYGKEGTEVAGWLNSIGITAVVLQYRVPGNRDGALMDVQRALRMVRHRAAEWNIDPERIGILGFSAGGHLSARIAANPNAAAYPAVDDIDKDEVKISALILVYPAYLAKDGVIAPEVLPTKDSPKTALFHNDDDVSYVPGSRVYEAKLKERGVSIQSTIYSTGGHGYGLHCEGAARAWPVDCRKWLADVGFCQMAP